MKKFFLIFILLFSTLFAENICFKDKLKQANKGDFIVFEYNKIYSVLSIFCIDHKHVILEEITIPKNAYDKKNTFRNWIAKGAEKNTSWTMYKIDIEKNKIIDAFSISRNCFVNLVNNESFLTGLLDLELTKLKNHERKKIGPLPQWGEIDRRSLWNPPKTVESKKMKKATFDAFRSIWPNDGSEFSSKIFEIYFDSTFSLPYFIEINNGHISYMIKSIDSGKDLNSKIAFFPRRLAEITQIKEEKPNLILSINNANHFDAFNLFAIDFSREERIIHPLEFNIRQNDDLTFLEINLDDLNQIFEKNHKYRFIATPNFEKNIFIESKDLFIWK